MYSGIKNITITDGTTTVTLNSIYPSSKIKKVPVTKPDLNGNPIVVEMLATLNVTAYDVNAFAQLRKWMLNKTIITQIIAYGFGSQIEWNENSKLLVQLKIPKGVGKISINISVAKRGSTLNIVVV